MARSKTLHKVTKRYEITTTGDPHDAIVAVDIDLATELSQRLGRTIKQGNSFRVVGWGASVVGQYGSLGTDLDLGLSATCRVKYCPTTYHSAKAWRMLNSAYWKQSAFREGLGVKSRYDEFEVAYKEGGESSRTSQVYCGGISDPQAEHCFIYAPYDDEDGLGISTIGLNTLYDAHHPVEAPGQITEVDLLFDDQINYKAAKFASKFPEEDNFTMAAHFSSTNFYDHDVGLDDIYPQGASAGTENFFLPDDNHIPILCGRMNLWAWVLPESDIHVVEDTLYLYVTFYIEGWNTLNRTKKSRRSAKRGGRRRGKRSR